MGLWVVLGVILLLGGSAVGVAVVDNNEWTRFDISFQKIGGQYGVDWTWLKAFALNESDLGRDSRVASGDTSSDGLSWGLMQVTLKTAQGYDSNASIDLLSNLNPADYSIDLAAHLISDNKNQFDSNDPAFIEKVVKSYNQGAGNTKREFMGMKTKYYDAVQEYWARWQRNLERVNA